MSALASVVTLTIDDREVGATAEQTILQVARENGIAIPTLCNMEGLTPIGACRLCLVEIVGSRRLAPACVARVSQGLVVRTHSERLDRYRRMIVEMLFTEGNHVCAVCVSNGRCELQDLARSMGILSMSLPYRYPKREVDASHRIFALDRNRCVLCTRCVRACDEIEGAHTWDVMGRGIDARVITDLNQPWGASESCTSCGKCVHLCPTGALFDKSASVGEMSKRGQFLPYLTTMREERQ